MSLQPAGRELWSMEHGAGLRIRPIRCQWRSGDRPRHRSPASSSSRPLRCSLYRCPLAAGPCSPLARSRCTPTDLPRLPAHSPPRSPSSDRQLRKLRSVSASTVQRTDSHTAWFSTRPGTLGRGRARAEGRARRARRARHAVTCACTLHSCTSAPCTNAPADSARRTRALMHSHTRTRAHSGIGPNASCDLPSSAAPRTARAFAPRTARDSTLPPTMGYEPAPTGPACPRAFTSSPPTACRAAALQCRILRSLGPSFAPLPRVHSRAPPGSASTQL